MSCKTFHCCTIDINLSLKTLVFVLKRYYYVMKLSLDLYVFHVYFEYIYLRISCMYTYVLSNIFVHVFLVIFRIEKYYGIMFIFLNKFNNADWFHFQSHPVGFALLLRPIFVHGPVRLGFEDWYICKNIYCWETTLSYMVLDLFLKRENEFDMTVLLFIYIICFQLEVKRILHFYVAVFVCVLCYYLWIVFACIPFV